MKIPEQKKKMLERYAKDGYSIIHFSNLENKLGINPETDFNTPAGVYGYILNKKSLSCLLDPNKIDVKYSGELYKRCDLSAFAIKRKYIYVARFKQRNKITVRINKNGYSNLSENIIKDMYEKIKNIPDKYFDRHIIEVKKNDLEVYEEIVEIYRKKSKFKSPFGQLWNATRKLARSPVAWGRILIELGIGAIFDHGAGIIHPAEPSQAVILETYNLNIIYHGKNPLLQSKRLGVVERRELAFKSLYSDAKKFNFKKVTEYEYTKYTRIDEATTDDSGNILKFHKRLYSCEEIPSITFFSVDLKGYFVNLPSNLSKNFIILRDKKNKKTYISIVNSNISKPTTSNRFLHYGYDNVVPKMNINEIDFGFYGEADFSIESNKEMNLFVVDFLLELSDKVLFKKEDFDRIHNFLKNSDIIKVHYGHILSSKTYPYTNEYSFIIKDELFNKGGLLLINVVRVTVNILGEVTISQNFSRSIKSYSLKNLFRNKTIFIKKNPYLKLKKIIKNIIEISRKSMSGVKRHHLEYDSTNSCYLIMDYLSETKDRVFEFLDANDEGPTLIDMNYEDVE